jgi:HAD superfamily hydrolase (TIGR01459 family)
MTALRDIAGLGEIAGGYDAFLLDQYGVLHDGMRLYPGALEALRQLAAQRKIVLVLTNSGKRAAANRERLVRLGIGRELFLDAVSSGEAAWVAIRDGRLGEPFRPGRRAYLVGRAGESYGFDDLDLKPVDRPGQADFLLILGSNAPATSLDDYADMLRAAAAEGIPALCANPDRLMLTPSGRLPAPGAIAARYAQLGGPVTWIGKPHADIYRAALTLAGNPPPARALAIGDSLEHDIAGAAAAGLATLLIRAGVSEGLSLADLEVRCRSAGVFPNWTAGELRW